MKVGSENVNKYRLVRDNRQGMTCHTAAATYVNLGLGLEHERANDVTFSTTLILIKNIFSPSRVAVVLNHALVHMDRGHWLHAP